MVLRLLVVLATLTLGDSVSVEAQQLSRGLPRIGVLSPATLTIEAFEEALRARGYVDGQNILIERRSAGGRPERFPGLAAELVRLQVDAIVAPTTPAALAAKKATSTIPVVMVTASDPVGSGLVASLARPGGNVTGTTILGTELSAKRLDLLRQAFPGVSRVMALWSSSNRAQTDALRRSLNETQVAANALGVRLVPLELKTFIDFAPAVAAIARERPEALLVLPDSLAFAHRAQIVNFAMSHRLPGMYPEQEYVEVGGLMAYGVDLGDLYRQAAVYVDKILKGANPSNLPIEQPTKFELVINQKTARTLGLMIPPSLLLRADQVID